MHYKEGGLRRVPQPQAVEAPDPERVHFPHHNKPTDTDYGIESQMGVKAQPVVEDRRRGFRVPAARRPADELCLEGALGRKAQVEDPRGGLGAATPGDKLYATPDTAPGFFKGGGVLPGSNWGVERKARAGKTSLLGGTAIRSLREHEIKRRAEARRTAHIRRKQGIALAAEREHVQQLEGWERTTGCMMRELKDKDVERLDREAQEHEVATATMLADEVDFGEDLP